MRPPMVALAAGVMAVIVGGCSGRSAWDRRYDRLVNVPLGASSQPPDPCSLLSVDEVKAAVGSPVLPPKAASAATSFDEQRRCFWSAHDELVHLAITDVSAIQAVDVLNATLNQRPVRPRTITDRFKTLTWPGASPLEGVGDAAWFWASGKAAKVGVLAGQVMFRIDVSAVWVGDSKQKLTDLADDALKRLAPTTTNRKLCEFVTTRDVPRGTLGQSAVDGGAFQPALVDTDKWPPDAIIDLNLLGDKVANVPIPAGTPIAHAQWTVEGPSTPGVPLPNPANRPSTGHAGPLC